MVVVLPIVHTVRNRGGGGNLFGMVKQGSTHVGVLAEPVIQTFEQGACFL